MAVPSFNNDSPSNNTSNLTGAPTSFNKATTATGSVALIIAAIVNAPLNSNSNIYNRHILNINPNSIVPTNTPKTANIIIYINSYLIIKGSILYADSNINAGININNSI